MKRILKIVTWLVALTGVSTIVLRKLNLRRKLEEVADKGYETAQDILFPGEELKSKKLHYGPVIPA